MKRHTERILHRLVEDVLEYVDSKEIRALYRERLKTILEYERTEKSEIDLGEEIDVSRL